MTRLRSITTTLVFLSFAFCSSAIQAQSFRIFTQDIEPHWSPDGRLIAFSSNRTGNYDIYVWDLYTHELHKMSSHLVGNFYPEWSPGIDALSFYSEKAVRNETTKQLYVMSRDSVRIHFPENASRDADMASWSRRTRLLVFHSVDSTGYYQIYTRRPDETDKHHLTASPWDHLFPRWSPDGSKILYVSNRGGSYNLYLMNANGSDHVQLTHGESFKLDAIWSPDGKKIAFSSNMAGNFDIYVMNSDGSHLQKLTSNPGYDLSPDWSPDGSKLLFISNRSGNFDIFSMKSDGTDIKQLTSDYGQDFYASWSPDGREILFVSDRNGPQRIYIMKADGSKQHELDMESYDF